MLEVSRAGAPAATHGERVAEGAIVAIGRTIRELAERHAELDAADVALEPGARKSAGSASMDRTLAKIRALEDSVMSTRAVTAGDAAVQAALAMSLASRLVHCSFDEAGTEACGRALVTALASIAASLFEGCDIAPESVGWGESRELIERWMPNAPGDRVPAPH